MTANIYTQYTQRSLFTIWFTNF